MITYEDWKNFNLLNKYYKGCCIVLVIWCYGYAGCMQKLKLCHIKFLPNVIKNMYKTDKKFNLDKKEKHPQWRSGNIIKSMQNLDYKDCAKI